MGHNVVIFSYPCKDYNSDTELALKLMEQIHSNQIDGVICFNYFPIVAITCNACNIQYYSWIYDSPHLTLYSKSVFFPTNHIGSFDKDLVDELRSYGVNTIFHVPLACDIQDMKERIESPVVNRINPNCDVSFVGSLYTDLSKRNYYDKFYSNADKQDNIIAGIWNNIENAVQSQCFNYKENLIKNNPNVDYAYLNQLMIKEGAMLGTDYFASVKDIVVSSVLERKVTISERHKLFKFIAKHCYDKYDFKLFTTSDTSNLGLLNSVNCGPVDYQSEMPSVFAKSKINIHITLKSIHTGIPLRVLDILSCGGFLLCDPQTEILENFTDGQDIAIYHSPEECADKIDYYLSHEDARIKIAKNGQKKANELFNYKKMLTILLNK